MPGPVILDLVGLELNNEERDLLQHPLVSGVILFGRNYQSPQQVTELCQAIRSVRQDPLLITVDQEGGRVQRFRKDFLALPAMATLGVAFDHDPQRGLALAETCGWLMAAEVLSVSVDLSFAPVLDVDKSISAVIGDRSFHRDPLIVAKIARAFIRGMHQAGMAAVGKHFPGHGSVAADSHEALPVDPRTFEEIARDDLVAFAELIQSGIQALMPAHIVFPAVDQLPVGFSPYWLQEVLRKQMQFSGVIFSDDLNMDGANGLGSYDQRARAALQAGCDIVLICNNRKAAIEILDNVSVTDYVLSTDKFNSLRGRFSQSFAKLHDSAEWQEKCAFLQKNNEHTLI